MSDRLDELVSCLADARPALRDAARARVGGALTEMLLRRGDSAADARHFFERYQSAGAAVRRAFVDALIDRQTREAQRRRIAVIGGAIALAAVATVAVAVFVVHPGSSTVATVVHLPAPPTTPMFTSTAAQPSAGAVASPPSKDELLKALGAALLLKDQSRLAQKAAERRILLANQIRAETLEIRDKTLEANHELERAVEDERRRAEALEREISSATRVLR